MVPDKALPVFVHDIKQLLDQAMPGLYAKAKEQLLLHQFVVGTSRGNQQAIKSNSEHPNIAVYGSAHKAIDLSGERAVGRRINVS